MSEHSNRPSSPAGDARYSDTSSSAGATNANIPAVAPPPTSTHISPTSPRQQHHQSALPKQASPPPSAPGPVRTQPLHLRPVHSCSECRRKKLRCDRERPCQQCRKSRREDMCNYDNISAPRTRTRGPYHRLSTATNGSDAQGDLNKFRLEARESKREHNQPPTLQPAPNTSEHNSTSSYAIEPGYAPVRQPQQPDTSAAADTQSWNAVNAPRAMRDPEQSRPMLPSLRAQDLHTNGDIKPPPSMYPDVAVIEDLQRRVKALEDALLHRHDDTAAPPSRHELPPVIPHANGLPSPSSPRVGHTQRQGRVTIDHRDRSRYRGPCDRALWFQHFAVADRFLSMSCHDRNFKADVGVLYERFHRSYLVTRPANIPKKSYDLAHELLSRMPSESVCKTSVQHYIFNFETGIRILHLPDFMLQADKLWAEKQLPSDDFTPQLAAVIIVGSLLTPANQLVTADGQLWNAAPLLSLLLAWEESLSGNELLTFAVLQTRVLMLLARILLGTPAVEMSRICSSTVRSAQLMGLHTDPSTIENHTVPQVQAELRRRLWCSIVELDLTASVTSGLPPTISTDAFTTRAPANLNDGDLSTSSTGATIDHPLENWTESTFQVVLARSHLPRLKLAAANSLSTSQETKACFDRVLEALRDLHNLRSHRRRSVKGPAGDLLGDMIVETQLLRSMIYASSRLSTIEIDATQKRQYVDALLHGAQTILANLDHLHPNYMDAKTFGTGKYWTAYFAIANDLITMSGLLLCAAVGPTSQEHQRSFTPLSMVAGSMEHDGGAKNQILRNVDGVVSSMITYCNDMVRRLKDTLYLSLALQSARDGHQSPEQNLRTAVHEFIDRCTYRARHEDRIHHSAASALRVGHEQESILDLVGIEANELELINKPAANGHIP